MPNACCSHYSPGINLITFYLPAFLSFSCSASVRILTAPMAPRASPKQSNAAAVLFTSTLIFLPSSSGIAAFRSTPSGLRQQNPTMHARILAKCPRHKKNHIKGACVRACVTKKDVCVTEVVCERWCVQSCVWKRACDKVVWERWCVTKWCVKDDLARDGVWQSCVLKMVRWKMVCDKVVCERWCGERWCVTKWCVKDGVVKDGVRQSVMWKILCERFCVKDGVCVCVQNQKHEPHTKLWGTIPTLVFRVPLLHPYQTKPLEWLDICTGIWSVRKMPSIVKLHHAASKLHFPQNTWCPSSSGHIGPHSWALVNALWHLHSISSRTLFCWTKGTAFVHLHPGRCLLKLLYFEVLGQECTSCVRVALRQQLRNHCIILARNLHTNPGACHHLLHRFYFLVMERRTQQSICLRHIGQHNGTHGSSATQRQRAGAARTQSPTHSEKNASIWRLWTSIRLTSKRDLPCINGQRSYPHNLVHSELTDV